MGKAASPRLRFYRRFDRLRLPEEDAKEAARRNMSQATLLAHVVEQDCRRKHDHAREQGFKGARPPVIWTPETVPFARQPKLDRKRAQALHDTLDFIPRGENFISPGGSGGTAGNRTSSPPTSASPSGGRS